MLNSVTTFFIVLMPCVALAGWSDPKVVVTASWGNGPGQFHLYIGESGDDFPKIFSVDKDGNILIPDEGNKRLTIYDKAGHLKKVLTKPHGLPAEDEMYRWPGGFVSYEGGNSIVISCRYEKIPGGIKPYKKCLLDYDGRILAEVPMAYVVPIQTGYILRAKDRSYLYTPTGKMVEERPAALINKSYLEDEYGGFAEFKEYKDKQLKKCSKKLESLALPSNQSRVVRQGGRGFDEESELIAEYGHRIVTSNCDVYLWKRTPEAYSILKWTWFDEQKQN